MNRNDEEIGKLFIGGVAVDVQDQEFKEYFEKFGEITDCVLMRDSITRQGRGFGFVTFKDPANAEKVLTNGPHTISGKTIDPKPSTPRGQGKKPVAFREGGGDGGGSSKIFIGGIAQGTSEDDIKLGLSKFGEVLDVKLMADTATGRQRGFGFVSFSSQDAVHAATSEHYVQINGKTVEIKPAEDRKKQMVGGGGPGGYGGQGGGGGQWGGPAPYNQNQGGYGYQQQQQSNYQQNSFNGPSQGGPPRGGPPQGGQGGGYGGGYGGGPSGGGGYQNPQGGYSAPYGGNSYEESPGKKHPKGKVSQYGSATQGYQSYGGGYGNSNQGADPYGNNQGGYNPGNQGSGGYGSDMNNAYGGGPGPGGNYNQGGDSAQDMYGAGGPVAGNYQRTGQTQQYHPYRR